MLDGLELRGRKVALRITRPLIRSPLFFWLGMFAITAIYIAGTWAVDHMPSKRAKMIERERLCSLAIEQVLAPISLLAFEQGKYLVHELRCDLLRQGRSPA